MMRNGNNSREDVTRICDIFKQLDQCVVEAEKAKRTGQWNTAYQAKQKLDKQIDTFDVVEGVRFGTQIVVVIKACLEGNWEGALAALATISAIVVAYKKRHSSCKPPRR